jgi:glycine/D-amino acid oxidase-like deaminating enzyme
MKKNRSPWLHELRPGRESHTLGTDIQTDVAIVGGGIAGIATAFYALKYTDQKVVLLERFKLAHGATGHNAGQITSYFERGFSNLVKDFGLEKAAKGQKAAEDAWNLLDEMYTDAGLDIPLSRFIGHAGFSSEKQTLDHLENNRLRKEAGLLVETIRISTAAPFLSSIPEKYQDLYTVVQAGEIQSLLETEVSDFVSTLSFQKGCVNSALFTEEVAQHLLTTYPERFELFEHSQIRKVVLKSDHALLDGGEHEVRATRVVLCTNGFEHLHILNETGLDIDAKYHHLVEGVIGYMSGYLEKFDKQPTAISYFPDSTLSIYDPYFYLTRRAYEYEKGVKHNLISVGGLDTPLLQTAEYSLEDEFPEVAEETLDTFIRRVYDSDPNKNIDYLFTWHGLMGYTKHGVRLIGPEPKNPVLLYNLGCNGVGILPSLHGGREVARHLAGEKVEASMFDVPVRNIS